MGTLYALVVEDDPDAASFFALTLEAAGYITDIAPDGRSARNSINAQWPALVILDMVLPDISGKEILQYIRADERSAKTWVIVATGVDKTLEDEVEQSANMVLTKPVDYKQLLAMAKRIHGSFQ